MVNVERAKFDSTETVKTSGSPPSHVYGEKNHIRIPPDVHATRLVASVTVDIDDKITFLQTGKASC